MPADSLLEQLRAQVVDRLGADPAAVRAVVSPYRVCPLGAHVDHQLGQVTGMAIDQGVLMAFAPTDAPQVRLLSRDFPGEVRFALDTDAPASKGDWGNYARGASVALRQRHRLHRGIVGITSGRLGEGGLSSSAAIGVAYLLALEAANGLQLSDADNIALDQAIENGYLGLRNGILDQATILLSRQGCLTHIDCRDGSSALIEPPARMPAYRFLIAFSGLRQALVGTDYNRRVEECTAAAAALLSAAGRAGVRPVLGNVTRAEYEAHRGVLQGTLARRAEHFFTEVERVRCGLEAWRGGRLEQFGALVSASGDSSIRNYECGCAPLIDLYQMLVETPGVYGARFSGAGFRGCCVALVAASQAESAAAAVRQQYRQRHAELAAAAPVLVCASADGARLQ